MRSPELVAYLASFPDRCAQGFAPVQHPTLCDCGAAPDEWSIFVDALQQVAREHDGVIRQAHMRPLIRGRIEPKHIGRLYTKAKDAGVIHHDGYEKSNDRAGKNAGRMEPRYRLGPAPH